jgi:hypothetical protein
LTDISLEQFNELMKIKDLDYKCSKYLSVELGNTLKSAPSQTANEVLSDMLRFASSQSEISSVFAKVS